MLGSVFHKSKLDGEFSIGNIGELLTGGMKKVIGTSSAVAMVAVRPGIQPTNKPNSAEQKITKST